MGMAQRLLNRWADHAPRSRPCAAPSQQPGLRLWSPGQKLRVGLGGDVGMSWNHLVGALTSCSHTPSDGARSGDGVVTFGGGVDLDHDIGQPGGFGMRYGLGGALVVAGCAGGILPTPTVALRYAF